MNFDLFNKLIAKEQSQECNESAGKPAKFFFLVYIYLYKILN